MTAREFVKILLAKECMTLKELAQLASEKGSKKFSPDGLSQKMRLGTLGCDDGEFFPKVLGYEMIVKTIEEEN